MLKIDKLQNDIFGPVSLCLEAGQSMVVRGQSGSGKTRFMRAVADLDQAFGEVVLGGAVRSLMPAFEWRKQVRFVPADSAWWYDHVSPHFSPEFDLVGGMSKLGLKEELINRQVSRLSTGERQRLAFLRAIADNPKVLLLDEPTSALDAETTEALELFIETEMSSGVIVFLASHSEAQASRFGGRSIIFSEGCAEIEIDQTDQSGACGV